ncbi:MAG: hypothetical protein ACOYEL_04520 [Saccharofermentanales bacterium]|jgi:hypothetical protein
MKLKRHKFNTTIGKIVMYLMQWTWGIFQNLLGLLLLLCIRHKTLHHFHGAVIVEYPAQKFKQLGAFTLGMFIFCNDPDPETKQNLLTHEYGHTIQSIIYGPFYIPLVGFCSLRWAHTYSKNREQFNAANIFYTDKYPEKQANYWGEKILGQRGIYW